MSGGWRTLGVTAEGTVMWDGTPRSIRAGWDADGLGGLLNHVAPHLDSEATLVLDGAACERLGLPTDRTDMPRTGWTDHPLVQDMQRAGWRIPKVSDWTEATREGGPSVYICAEPLLDLTMDKQGVWSRAPFYRDDFRKLVKSLDTWHQLAGVPWRGTPGMAGTAMLERHEKRSNAQRGKFRPTWKPSEVGPTEAYESPYTKEQWAWLPKSECYLHAYDLNRAYVAAAMLTEVSAYGLKHTGRTEFNPRKAGWWHVELPAWNVKGMPDPAGYHAEDEPGKARLRWVTTPTMALLAQCVELGIYGGTRVIDSWTGPATDTVLRPLAERLGRMYALVGPNHHTMKLPVDHLITMEQCTKLVGREVFGMMNRESNWVYRPDWWFAIVAMNRSNLWRKMWRVYRHENRSPARIDTDSVYYASKSKNPLRSAPKGITQCPRSCGCNELDELGIKLGHFKVHGSYHYKGFADFLSVDGEFAEVTA